MKIELTSVMAAGEAPRADDRGEAHIRVLTNEPKGPEIWPTVQKAFAEGFPLVAAAHEDKFEKWFPELTELEEGECDYDGYGFECWFVLRARPVDK